MRQADNAQGSSVQRRDSDSQREQVANVWNNERMASIGIDTPEEGVRPSVFA